MGCAILALGCYTVVWASNQSRRVKVGDSLERVLEVLGPPGYDSRSDPQAGNMEGFVLAYVRHGWVDRLFGIYDVKTIRFRNGVVTDVSIDSR